MVRKVLITLLFVILAVAFAMYVSATTSNFNSGSDSENDVATDVASETMHHGERSDKDESMHHKISGIEVLDALLVYPDKESHQIHVRFPADSNMSFERIELIEKTTGQAVGDFSLTTSPNIHSCEMHVSYEHQIGKVETATFSLKDSYALDESADSRLSSKYSTKVYYTERGADMVKNIEVAFEEQRCFTYVEPAEVIELNNSAFDPDDPFYDD